MVQIPSIQSLYTSILGNIETEFGVELDPNGKAFLRALAMVQAGKLWLEYLGIADVQANVWPTTASSEANGGTLEWFGRIKNMSPQQGTQGQYIVNVTGSAGETIDASTTFKSDDSSTSPGYLFVLDNAYTLSGSGDTITLRALTVGTIAVLKAADTLTCTQPLININTGVSVASVSISPVDAETIEQFRSRVVETYQLQPQGGAAADYRLWGREAAGVAQIYPYAVDGEADTVAVYVEAILADSVGPPHKGVPTSTILDAVTAIMAASNGLKPLGVMPVQVNAVTVKDVNITFTGSTGTPGISADQQVLITAGLTEAIALIRPFIPGADIITKRNDTLTVNTLIQVALNAAPGCYFTGATMTVGGSAVSTYNFDFGAIPFTNTVTYS